MFIIGITGGIGSGKSTLANYCKQAGFTVLDADHISKEITEKDGLALPEIIEAFGDKILDANGDLDRNKMAQYVFNDRRKLDLLSAIIHKYVIEQMNNQVAALEKKKEKLVFLDVPIPVKHGFLDLCDQVWVVVAEEEQRIQRLKARGMSVEEARRRMQMQMSNDEYKQIADIIVENNQDERALKQKIMYLFKQELAPRGIRAKADLTDHGNDEVSHDE